MTRSERGAAAVEFALVLPLLVLLFAGVAEMGRIYYLQATLSGAAREGARVMALRNDAGASRAAVRSAAGSVAVGDAQIAVSPGTGGCRSTAAAPVQATVTITFPTPLVSSLFGASVTVRGVGAMQCGG
ncbi:TadE/TadG family type IV pilus assembly protein [Microlunatus capsulatus]|uniref:Flp pilus assembly protein TadG n=1 Tax=Microlunatus capsulatus TaxID=99117 RepID=A0ABS4Z4R3_9ACTN|nr:TadE family protein [Microlunatus capsulatus]MBP2416020.1 Flp pilus assembly protein TadG [Microlunatus capsulatus]